MFKDCLCLKVFMFLFLNINYPYLQVDLKELGGKDNLCLKIVLWM